jgi:predicted RNA binding protein YcfA (HicA-like mRNA interferase family)
VFRFSLDGGEIYDRWAVVKVREMIRELEDDGWFVDRQGGSRRQFHHQIKRGTVTVPGKLSDDLQEPLVAGVVKPAELERRPR